MVEVKLYDIGEGMTEGTIVSYFVSEGDEVTEDQPVVELSTEKMVTELTAPTSGTISEIKVSEGDTIPVGTVIMTIDNGSGETQISEKTTPSSKAEEKAPSDEPKKDEEPVTSTPNIRGPKRSIAAPYTRKIARERGVNIDEVVGTGKAGRVTIEDVENHNKPRTDSTRSQAPSHEPLEDTVIPFKGRRKQIAQKMTKSLFTIPHVAHMEEVDMTNVLALRKEIKETHNVSVVAFFIKALAISLKEFPIFNATLDEANNEILLKGAVHMGIAVDTPDGLIVPVIKHCEQKSLLDIQTEMKALNQKALDNTLSISEMTGSTFTISNVGPLGSIGATPIINYPEVALIAFHKTKKMPVVNDNDEIVVRSMMNMTLSFDHRVADGGDAIKFTNKFKSLIEKPQLLMLEMI